MKLFKMRSDDPVFSAAQDLESKYFELIFEHAGTGCMRKLKVSANAATRAALSTALGTDVGLASCGQVVTCDPELPDGVLAAEAWADWPTTLPEGATMSNETNEHDQAAEAFSMGAQLAGDAARELATPMPPAEPVDPHQARMDHRAAHAAARAEMAKTEAPAARCPRVGDTVMYSPGPGQPGFPAGPFPATVDVVHNPEAVDLHYEISMGEGKPPAKGIVASALLAPNRHPIGSQYTWVYPG